ncbi:HdeD family acid-resistance protein [Vagococcus sp. JNUCC 83]
MSSIFRSIQHHAFARGILYLIIGFLIFLQPNKLFNMAVYLIVGYNVVLGLLNLFSTLRTKQNGQLSTSIFYFIVALIIWLFARPIASILPIFLGILVIIGGVSKISRAMNLKQYVNISYVPMLIYGVLLLLAGIFILFKPFSSLIMLFKFFGIVLALSGVSELVTAIKLRNYKNPDVF